MAAAAALFQVTDIVHFARGSAVNWVLVTGDTGVMLIDAGYPGDREDVLASLSQLGYRAGDVNAILLTHAHIDHLGSAIWFANEHRTPVYLPSRGGGPCQAGVPGAGIGYRCVASPLATPLGRVELSPGS